jgi:N-acetylglucosamine-6-phosphate deacetylase
MSRFVVRGHFSPGPGSVLSAGALVIDAGKVAEIRRPEMLQEPRDVSAVYDAAFVSPGFIDLQVNGGFGVEVGDDPEAIRVLARRLPETGVTAFLPTIVTAPTGFYPRALAAFEAAKDAPGARPLGLHMEGPFLAPARHGAHRRELIEHADPDLIDLFLGSEAVRLVTLAPERPGALEMIRRLTGRGILVSLGHTDAMYEQLVAGIDAGARMATHLYNAMSPFGHRAPGAIGAALADDRVTVGLIADGIHSHPASVKIALTAKHRSHVALVTDMMAAAGMPPGCYALGGQMVIVDGTSARLSDGTLAGSLLTMDKAVRNIVEWADVTCANALSLASEVPARLLGLMHIGRIHEGADADLVLLDANLQVQATIIRGEVVYRREGA